MTVTSSIWIGDTKHDFSSLAPDVKKEYAIKMKLQMLKAMGREPLDSWLLKNPTYAEHWEKL